jgi:alpha/beta superfamily hydrolase
MATAAATAPATSRTPTWDDWIEDVVRAQRWLAERFDAPQWIWGVRAGALLACAALREVAAAGLLLWQPIVSGRQHLAAFLRVATAGALLREGAEPASVKSLLARLQSGEHVDVAGYSVAPAVARAPRCRAGRAARRVSRPYRMSRSDERRRADAGGRGGRRRVGARRPCRCAARRVRTVVLADHRDRGRADLIDATAAMVARAGGVIAEEPVVFACEGEALVGVVSHGRHAAATGVAIVVGGPQYRIGSHRQFVLLARALADAGIPALRFDYRGMGDATGLQRTFEDVGLRCRGSGRNAVCSRRRVARGAVGLCDGASAALFHAARNPRVAGLVLINPWVRTEQGVARAYLGSY